MGAEIKGPLLLIGCGKMGSALLEGWLGQGLGPGDALVVEPALTSERAGGTGGVAVVAGPEQIPEAFRPAAIVFAVKPQVMDEVVPHYARYNGPETLFLSIAAGTRIKLFESHLGAQAAIVRVMPNTPAAVGRAKSPNRGLLR